jgi:hypothetical protein
LTHESRSKDAPKATRYNVYVVDCDQSISDDEPHEVHATKLVWPTKAKSLVCSCLEPAQKNQQEEVTFTFSVAKYDKIFDKLHKSDNI